MTFPAVLTDQMTLVRGDSYRAVDGRQLIFSVPFGAGIPDLTGCSVQVSWYTQLGVDATLTVTATIQNPKTNAQQITIELTPTQTLLLTAVAYLVSVVATLSDVGTSHDYATLMRIACTVGSPPG